MHSPDSTRKSSCPDSPWYRPMLAGQQHRDEEADLREARLPLELRPLAEHVAPPPGRVARVDDEPAIAFRHEPCLGLLENGLRNHEGIVSRTEKAGKTASGTR